LNIDFGINLIICRVKILILSLNINIKWCI